MRVSIFVTALLLAPLAVLIAAEKDGVAASGSGVGPAIRHYIVRVDGVAAIVHLSNRGF